MQIQFVSTNVHQYQRNVIARQAVPPGSNAMARLVDNSYFVAAAMGPSMPEVKKRDDVEDQAHEEGRKERDATKPRKHELAVAGARRRLGNTDNVVKSSE
jgi:hypothetical protein